MKVLEGKRARKDPNELRDSFKDLSVKGVTQASIHEHLEQVPLRYFSHTGREEVALHIGMVDQYTKQDKPGDRAIVSWRNDLRRTMTVVDVVITDQTGLLEITGALAVTGLNILGARAITRHDQLAIDVFYVEERTGAS